MDNVSCHSTGITIPFLHYFTIKLQPDNATSVLQPLDLGVIKCVKDRYKQLVTQRAVHFIDSGMREDLYTIDVRMGAMWKSITYQMQSKTTLFKTGGKNHSICST